MDQKPFQGCLGNQSVFFCVSVVVLTRGQASVISESGTHDAKQLLEESLF
jgi:hypothetical protein